MMPKGQPMTEEQKARMRAGKEAARARRAAAPPPVAMMAGTDSVATATPPVSVQMGPTPGYAFAVFRDNPEFHERPVEIWDAAAKLALMRKVAILGGELIGDLRKEPLRPFNWMCEYRVAR